jgi:colanic acid biosynthesis glycosyl transferase WcaI
MRILIYGLNYAPEPVGIGKYSGELGSWLASRGHQVRVIAAPPYFPEWKARDNRYRRETKDGVQIWRCPLWVPRKPNGLTRLVHLASFAMSSLVPLFMQKRWQPNLILCVAPALFCAPAALWLGGLCGQRTVTWLHIQDFELDAAFQLGLLKGDGIRGLAETWERRTLQCFDRVSSISEAMLNHAVGKGVAREKAVLLPNWVDIHAIDPQSRTKRSDNSFCRELGIEPEHLVLLYSGSMNKKQGLEMLVEVIQSLSNNKQLVWILAGEGPGQASLAESTRGLPQVRIMPLQPIERLNDWLNLADIHLLPQKAAAADLVLPSKLLGILASGRPVVAGSPSGSALGAMAEQAGCRAEPGDPKGFAQAVNLLATNEELRLQLGRQARQMAEERFDMQRVLQRFELDAAGAVGQKVEEVSGGTELD